MYSRNYGRGDISAKITPPPSYSGSAIHGGEPAVNENEEPKLAPGTFAPFSQNIALAKNEEEQAPKKQEERECRTDEKKEENAPAEARGKEKSSFLSSFLPDLSTEDLILIGIIIALAFDLADRDILLVALVAAVVIM